MSEMQQGGSVAPSISNVAGAVIIVIILALTGVIMYQQSQLTNAVTALATVSAKCAK